MKRAWLMGALGLGCLATASPAPTVKPAPAAVSDQSSTPPSTRPSARFDHRASALPGAPRRGSEWWHDHPPAGSALGPLTDQERADIETFMKTYSPSRWEKFQDIPDSRKGKIFAAIRARYHWMQKLKDNDPQMYDIRLRRLPIEDKMFSINWELHHGDPSEKKKLHHELRDEVRLFVDNSLEERKLRLDRLADRVEQEQTVLKREQARMKDLSSNHDALVDEGTMGFENDHEGMLRDIAGPFMMHPPTTAPSAPANVKH